MDRVEPQIAEWKSYVSRRPALDDRDVEELETHLRDQIAELDAAGLSPDEAFLIAVKRMGEVDGLAREFAREHSGRLWKQLVLAGNEGESRESGGWFYALVFALGAAATLHIARLIARFPEQEAAWLLRNVGLFVLPFLAGYLAHRRRFDVRRWAIALAPFALVAIIINLYPYDGGSATELLVALHLPVMLWFVIAFPYMGGAVRSHERRMDFVRFTGEWFIYYVLIALGGGVLLTLTGLILEPLGGDVAESVIEWVLPAGAAGAVVVAAWLVESKQHVVENMSPVLTMLFTPLFAIMLTIAVISYVVSGVAGAFDRELLGVFDALLVVVLGLVLYALSARDSTRPAGLMDHLQLVAVVAALVLDVIVLVAMLGRIGELGFTPNRVAALGLNLVLLVNLAGSAWLSARFVAGRITFRRLERWQMSYLPVYALWTAAVVALLPPLFAFA